LGVDVSVAIGARRTAIGLAARVATSAGPLVAWTVAAFGQSAFDFTKSTDPLFASVQPANLSNTIQYAVTAASHGDIESAISAYEQLRFYNPKLAATRFQLGVLYYQLGYAQARAAICRPRWPCPTLGRSFARRSRICSKSSIRNSSPTNSTVSHRPD
jgi:tetratricopeptide (TPR) repeat protein